MQLPGAAATGPLGSPNLVRKEEDYEDFWTENGVPSGGKAGNNGGGMSQNTMSGSTAGGGVAGGAGARGAKGTSGKDDEWENW